jgi:hypothetical protein
MTTETATASIRRLERLLKLLWQVSTGEITTKTAMASGSRERRERERRWRKWVGWELLFHWGTTSSIYTLWDYQIRQCSMTFHEVLWGSTKFHWVLWSSMEFHWVPSHSMRFHPIPGNSMEFWGRNPLIFLGCTLFLWKLRLCSISMEP